MAQIVTDKKKIENIATAIRNKGGSDEPMLPGDMPTRISDLQVGDVVMSYRAQEKPRSPQTAEPQSIFIEANAESDIDMMAFGALSVTKNWQMGYGLNTGDYPLPESDGYYHWRMQVNEDGEYDFCYPCPICLPSYYTLWDGYGIFSDTGANADVIHQQRADGTGVPAVVDWETVEFLEDSTVKPIGYSANWNTTTPATDLGGTFYRFNYTFAHPEFLNAEGIETYQVYICSQGAANTYRVVGRNVTPTDNMIVHHDKSGGRAFRPEGAYDGTFTRFNYPNVGNVFSALTGSNVLANHFLVLIPASGYGGGVYPTVGYIWCGPNISIEDARQKLISDDYRIFIDLAPSSFKNGRIVQPQSVRDAANAIKLEPGFNEFHAPTATVYTIADTGGYGVDWGMVLEYKKYTQYSDYAGAAGVTWYAEDDWEQESPHSCVALYEEGQANPAGTYRESRW